MAVRRAAVAVSLGLVSLTLAGAASSRPVADLRVTVFGDSAATAMAYDPDAKKILGRGIDLRLEVAACRRVGDTSCPYDGVRPPTVIDRATELARELGPVVVVVVGYNDFEDHYAAHIDEAIAVFRKMGVQHVLWATLRAERQSWANMNEMIVAAAKRFPELTLLDWNGLGRQHPDWLQPDGIHLTPSGARGMATMINEALVELGATPRAAAPAARRLLAIASRTLPAGRRGREYSTMLRATGGTAPYRWSRAGGTLAPGLRLSANGRLTGTPTRAGTFRLRARVVDGTRAARVRLFTLRIA